MDMKKICFSVLVVAMVATAVHAKGAVTHAPEAATHDEATAPVVNADAPAAHADVAPEAHGAAAPDTGAAAPDTGATGGVVANAPGPAVASGSTNVAPAACLLGVSLLSLIGFYLQ